MTSPFAIPTANLNLVLQTPAQIREFIEALSPDERAGVSPVWLALVDGAQSANPWIHGFVMELSRSGQVVGRCGYKGPPTAEGSVEIAYGVDPKYQGRGFATETTRAMVSFAFESEQVKTVLAHTLPEPNASTRVLTKCGFRNVGEVIDPEDGRVWRWEIGRSQMT